MCQHEQVNNPYNISNRQKEVWTIFEQLNFAILREGWETGKESDKVINLVLTISQKLEKLFKNIA